MCPCFLEIYRMNQELRQLNSAQKAGFISLLVFALVTVSFSFLHLRNTVYGRFIVHKEQNQLNLGQYDETVRLQSIDTDKDGLSDYDELYMYNTSPYLPDTDSDKRTDAQEITDGTNPLCPEGKVCQDQEFGSGTVSSSTPQSPLLSDTATPDNILLQSQLGGAGGSAADPAAVAAILQDPVQLRQLILNTGKISKEDLSRIDDTTLKGLAEEMLKEYMSSTSTTKVTTTTP